MIELFLRMRCVSACMMCDCVQACRAGLRCGACVLCADICGLSGACCVCCLCVEDLYAQCVWGLVCMMRVGDLYAFCV